MFLFIVENMSIELQEEISLYYIVKTPNKQTNKKSVAWMSVTLFRADLGTKACSLVLEECPSLKATLRKTSILLPRRTCQNTMSRFPGC